MTQRSYHTRPVVRSRAGFHGHRAARLRCEELHHLRAPELSSENYRSIRSRAVRLTHILGQIQTDDANFLHGRPLRCGFDTTTLAHWMPSGASTPSLTQEQGI